MTGKAPNSHTPSESIGSSRPRGDRTAYEEYKARLGCYLRSNSEYPRSIFLEITPLCNLRCVLMSFENFRRIMNPIAGKFNFQVNFTYSGEPLVNREIARMVRYLSDREVPTSIYSNAMLLSHDRVDELIDSGLDRYIVSFDSVTKETYESIRIGSRFEKVVENLHHLIKARNRRNRVRPFVEMQMVVTRENRHELDRFKELAEKIGVDNAYSKSLYIYRASGDAGYVEKVSEYFVEGEFARYERNKKGELLLKNKGICPELQSCVITVDGDVVMCCFDLKGEHTFGNAVAKPLNEIWDSDRYRKFRATVMAKRKLPICDSCIPSAPIKKDLREVSES